MVVFPLSSLYELRETRIPPSRRIYRHHKLNLKSLNSLIPPWGKGRRNRNEAAEKPRRLGLAEHSGWAGTPGDVLNIDPPPISKNFT